MNDEKQQFNSLSEIFEAWIGVSRKSDNEIRTFLKENKLDRVLSLSDVDAIVREKSYFSQEVLPAIYCAIPLSLVKNNKNVTLGVAQFNRLNHRAMISSDITTCLSTGFEAANELYEEYYHTKAIAIEEEKQQRKLREERHKLKLKVEKRALVLQKYRDKHGEDLNKKSQECRLQKKMNNPELLKEKDMLNNLRANRVVNCKKYYEKNKEEIAQKALEKRLENPDKIKEIKQRSKKKARFKQKTSKVILPLLQAIANKNASL